MRRAAHLRQPRVLLMAWIGTLALSLACASTRLDVDANHPAQPGAVVEPPPKMGTALAESFDPLRLSSVATSTAASSTAASSAASGSAAVGHVHGTEQNSTPPGTSETGAAETGAATQWTCPMHPEIIRPQAGQCPICGMQLVPVKKPAPGKEHSR
jgi:hypothetical protein